MIRICAWCKSYQGEKPPYEDPRVTHGICDACGDREVQRMSEKPAGDKVGAGSPRHNGLRARHGTSMGLRGSDPPAKSDAAATTTEHDMGSDIARDEIGRRRPTRSPLIPARPAPGEFRPRRHPPIGGS